MSLFPPPAIQSIYGSVLSTVTLYPSAPPPINSIPVTDGIGGSYFVPLADIVPEVSFSTISTTQITASTILLKDNTSNSLLYAQGGQLFLNNAPIGSGSIGIGSNLTLSNLGVADTISSISTFTEFLSAPQILASTISFTFDVNLHSGGNAVTIGNGAGINSQQNYSVAIGYEAGYINQQSNTIAIGRQTGHSNQGEYSIAIGAFAGSDKFNNLAQHDSTIVLNATGDYFMTSAPEGFYVKPIRNAPTATALFYDANSGEITYNTGSVDSNIGFSNVQILDTLSTISTFSVEISTGQLKVSTILFDDANIEYNLYSQGGQLYYNNALIAGSIPSDYAFSNLRVDGTLSTMSTYTEFVSTASLTTSTITFANNVQIAADGERIAIGKQAAENTESHDVAIGFLAGENGRGISIGFQAGRIDQGLNAIAIGALTANANQGDYAVAIGQTAGYAGMGNYSIALGYAAGDGGTPHSTIILNATGNSLNAVGPESFYVAPVRYDNTATLSTLFYNDTTKEITFGPGGSSISPDYAFSNLRIEDTLSTISTFSVEISTGQLKVSTILFDDANIEYNLYSQGGQLYYNNALIGGSIPSDYAFSNLRIEDTLSTMSTFTDYISAPTIDSLRINISTIDFSENRIKLRTNGSPNTIGIGSEAGEGQGDNAIAIGRYAGANNQGTSAIALGDNAGNNGQFNNAIAIGSFAGHEIQGDYAISIGYAVGQYNQASNAIAIGYQAGNHYQSTSAIAIGYQAGVNNQDDYSIAIGHQAGMNAQAASTIILNATGTEVSGIPGQQQSFYVAPVRYDPTTTLSTLFYNPGTYEITYGNPSQGASVSADYAFSTLRIADTLSTTSTFTDFISTANIETSTLSLSYNGSTYPLHTEGANKLYFDTNQVAFTSAFRFESGTISGGSFSGGQASVSFSSAFTTAPIVMLTFAGAPNEVATLFTSGVTGNGFNANQQQFSGDLTNPTSPPYIAPSGYDVSWLAYGQ